MHLSKIFWLLLFSFTAAWSGFADDMQIAVSIRYLQIKGTSHAHIYLYSGSGNLIRRLTNDNTGQDILPVFAPTGDEIIFTRRRNSVDELWTVQKSGGSGHRLNASPDWYDAARKNAACFTLFDSADESSPPEASGADATSKQVDLTSSDGSLQLILDRTGDDEKDYDEQQLGKLYRFRNRKTGKESLIGDWPGFETLWHPLHLRGKTNDCFLIEPPLQTVFFLTHLNSTDGDTVHALDLVEKRVIRLSPNYAVPIPIPGEPSFFAEAEERYVPLGDGKRTVNCSYLDRWDAKFRKIRYARPAPAIFGGASMWRKNNAPLTMDGGIRDG